VSGKKIALIVAAVALVAGLGLFVVLGGTVGLAALIRSFVVEAFEIQGPTMEPAYVDGDRVIVDKSGQPPSLGDVVIVRTPDGITTIKRVVAMPSDEIAMERDVITRNDERITPDAVGGFPDCFEEVLGGVRYRTRRASTSPPSDMDPVVVPEGHLFVLGDHRDRSNDSRFFGPLPIENVVGIVGEHYYRAEPRDLCEMP